MKSRKKEKMALWKSELNLYLCAQITEFTLKQDDKCQISKEKSLR